MLTSPPLPVWSRLLAATFTASLLALAAGPAMAADSTPTQAAPAVTFQIEVVGAVVRAGKFQLKDGDRVSLALARAGADVSMNPDLSRICVAHMGTVSRTAPTEIYAPSVECIDLYKWLQHGDGASNPVLHAGDVVVVMARSQKAPAQPLN
jgi:protein involved in polysaccharide export with SLBB domain